jgi:hypothetical protein
VLARDLGHQPGQSVALDSGVVIAGPAGQRRHAPRHDKDDQVLRVCLQVSHDVEPPLLALGVFAAQVHERQVDEAARDLGLDVELPVLLLGQRVERLEQGRRVRVAD